MTASTAKQPAAPSPELIAQIQQGLNHQKNKEMDQAEAIFSKAVAENPDNPDVLQIAAIFYDQVENYKKAQELLEKVVVFKPNDFAINKLLGKALLFNGNHKKAQIYLESAAANNMDDAECWFYLGECSFKAGDLRNAEALFTQSMRRRFTPKALNKTIICLLLQNQHRVALEMFQKATTEIEFGYESLVLYAIAQKISPEQSQPLLEQAISLNPQRPEAKNLQALLSEKNSTIIEAALQKMLADLAGIIV